MEKQQLVVQTKYKKLNGEIENIIETNEFSCETAVLENKKIILSWREWKVEIDEATFISATGGQEGMALWTAYNEENESWQDDEGNDIDLATYGITIDGNIENGDTLTVFNNSSKITYRIWQHAVLVQDNQEWFDYVSFNSSLPIQLQVGNLIDIITRKVEIDLDRYGFMGGIEVWNNTNKDVEVNLILTKKV